MSQTASDLSPSGAIQASDLLILYRPSDLSSYSFFGSQLINPFTNPLTTLGDTLIGGVAGAPTRLPGNIALTPQYLKSVGTGTVANYQSWQQIQLSDIYGIGTAAGYNVGTTNGTIPVLTSTGLPVVSSGLTTVTDPITSSIHGLNTTLANIQAEIVAIPGSTTNVLSSSVNTMSSVVNSISSTTPIINSNITSYDGNNLTTSINGISSTGLEIDGSTILGYDPVNSIASNTVVYNTALTNLYTYTQNIANGIVWQTFQAQATGNVTISNPGTAVFDTVTLTNGQFLFLNNQSTASQNGGYVFNGSGSALTRITTMNTWVKIQQTNISIQDSGGVNSNIRYYPTVTSGGTIDTTAISYSTWNTLYSGSSTVNISGLNAISVNPNLSITSLTLSTALSIANGGTGQTSPNAAFNALSPMTTAGDIIYGGASGLATRLAAGSGVLVGGSIPLWSTTPTLTGTNFSGIPNSATTAVSANTNSAIVARDSSGNFAANIITAALTGNVTGNTSGSSGSCTGNSATATTATNATNVATTQVTTNANFFPLMVSSSTNGNQAADLVTSLTYNPSTGAWGIPSGGSLGLTTNNLSYVTPGMKFSTTTLPASINWISMCFGNGIFVATAYGSTQAAYSLDNGKTWIAGGALPSASHWYINTCAYGNGVFFVTSLDTANGAYITVANLLAGNAWTAVTIASIGSVFSVAYGNGMFVYTGRANAIGYISVATLLAGGVASSTSRTGAWNNVVFGGGYFLATTFGNTVNAYSSDGINWTTAGAFPSSANWNALAYNPVSQTFVVVASGTATAYITLANLLASAAWTSGASLTSATYQAMSYGNGVLVVVSTSNAAAYSLNSGQTWTAFTFSGQQAFTYGNGVFVAAPGSSTTAYYGFYISEPQATNSPGNNQTVTWNDLYNVINNPALIPSYQTQGTFTPVLTGWTNVGTPTVTGTWSLDGNIMFISIVIVPSTTVSSTALTSTITGLPKPVNPNFDGVLGVIDRTSGAGLLNAMAIHNTSTITPPTISATADTIVISGTYNLS